jgi:hypothetical protein
MRIVTASRDVADDAVAGQSPASCGGEVDGDPDVADPVVLASPGVVQQVCSMRGISRSSHDPGLAAAEQVSGGVMPAEAARRRSVRSRSCWVSGLSSWTATPR